jgi:hypothetical protein
MLNQTRQEGSDSVFSISTVFIYEISTHERVGKCSANIQISSQVYQNYKYTHIDQLIPSLEIYSTDILAPLENDACTDF